MSRGDVFTLHQYQCHKIISKFVSILFCWNHHLNIFVLSDLSLYHPIKIL
jgi:hypothetical protein